MIERRNAVLGALRTGERDTIEDRLHGFAFGFNQLRALDDATFKFMLRNWVEAVDDQPYEAVHRACRAWNKGLIPWAKAGFPPQAPEIGRAVEEMRCGMLMEERELRLILGARVVTPPPPLTQEQRDACLHEVADLIKSLRGPRDSENERIMRELETESTAKASAEREEMAARLAADTTERALRRTEAGTKAHDEGQARQHADLGTAGGLLSTGPAATSSADGTKAEYQGDARPPVGLGDNPAAVDCYPTSRVQE